MSGEQGEREQRRATTNTVTSSSLPRSFLSVRSHLSTSASSRSTSAGCHSSWLPAGILRHLVSTHAMCTHMPCCPQPHTCGLPRSTLTFRRLCAPPAACSTKPIGPVRARRRKRVVPAASMALAASGGQLCTHGTALAAMVMQRRPAQLTTLADICRQHLQQARPWSDDRKEEALRISLFLSLSPAQAVV